MKKFNLLLILLLLFFVVSLYGNDSPLLQKNKKYGLVLPTLSNGIDETVTIPLTAKEAKELMVNSRKVRDYLNKPMGIIDNLTIPVPSHTAGGNPYFGGGPGDSMCVYFNPGAGCKILKVGFNIGHNGDDDTNVLCSGVNVSIHKARYDGESEAGSGGKYKLGDMVDGVWAPTDWYAANYEKSPVGKQISLFEFPVSIVADPKDQWEELDYSWLGDYPDNLGEPWVVMFVPTGGIGSVCGFTEDQNWDPPAPYRLWKWYADDPIWYLRHQVAFDVFCIVEFYENTPPVVNITTPALPHTFATGPFEAITAKISDIDANDAAQAGVDKAFLIYSVNGVADSTEMTVSGDEYTASFSGSDLTDEVNEIQYYVSAYDLGGLYSSSPSYSFNIYPTPVNTNLLFVDDSQNGLSFQEYLDALGYKYTFYDANLGLDPSVNNYDWGTVVIDNAWGAGTFPTRGYEDNVWAEQLNNGGNLLFVEQDYFFANDEVAAPTFAAGDFAYDFFGIEAAVNDPGEHADSIFAGVAGDPITDAFVANPIEIDLFRAFDQTGSNWVDYVTPRAEAVGFLNAESDNMVGVRYDNGTFKTVMLAFLMQNSDSVQVSTFLDNALTWFGTSKTSSVHSKEIGVVQEYNLSQNYPNPFNPETQISYSVAKASHVKLAVYNVLGQKVADLVDEHKDANSYKVTFDASDLTSGLYFYHLEAGDYSKTMKMMLLQ